MRNSDYIFFGTIFGVIFLLGASTFLKIDLPYLNLIWITFLGIIGFIKTLLSKSRFGKWLNFEHQNINLFMKMFLSIGFIIFFSGVIMLFI
jgi:hypothetical protein